MIRRNIYFYEESIEFLESIPGTVSENIRMAVTKYIAGVKSSNSSASASQRREDK